MPQNNIEIGRVLECTLSNVIIDINDYKTFSDNKEYLQIGKYVKIRSNASKFIIGIIQNIKAIRVYENDMLNPSFSLSIQPIGILDDQGAFERGGLVLPVPTEPVYLLKKEELIGLFSDKAFSFPLGKLVQNTEITLHIDGDKFFGKHIGVVGSTGAGKSFTVARILQQAVGINDNYNVNKESTKNAHIIIFDIHSEYKSAFELDDKENFTLNVLDVDKLALPYWLMNSEELESIFIDGNENGHHNQIAQFKRAVTLNKRLYNPNVSKITYDSPVYFNIQEVYLFIYNLSISTKTKEGEFAIEDNELFATLSNEEKLFKEVTFKKGDKINVLAGDYKEFTRFVSRFRTLLNDERLDFLLKPIKEDKTHYKTEDLDMLLKQFLGYIDQSNVTIIDLSGIPFEVLSITVSLISRLVFDFAFHYSKIRHKDNKLNNIPFLIVCEEAHNYVPKDNGAEYKASKKSIERIAKEGRKYGLSLMVVSQRPSEVSETIFAQCNNFVALRLTNINDQNYIKGLLPENSSTIADILPSLSAGECLIVGDATLIPSVVKMEEPNPKPKSESIKFHDIWQKDWKDITFEDVIKRWKKQK